MGLTEELAGITGEANVLTGRDVMAGYVTDWTGRYRGTAACVVRPASAAEVAEVIRACARHGAAIVPQGGNTGLVGGGVPWRRGSAAATAVGGRDRQRLPVVLSTR